MSERLQQVCIGLILVGTFIYFASDVFHKSYTSPAQKKSEAPAPSPAPTEAPSECFGPYVNVNVGATWKYVVVSSEESTDNKKPNTEQSNISISLTKKELGLLTFATTNSSTKTTSYTVLTCKISGIYGLPILSALETIEFIPKDLVEEIFSQVLFIPNRKVYKDYSWTSAINIASLLPIKIQSTPISIAFKVDEEQTKLILGKKYPTVKIVSSSDTKGPVQIGSLFDARYTLGENIGLIDAEIQIKVPTKSRYSVGITLQSFLNPL